MILGYFKAVRYVFFYKHALQTAHGCQQIFVFEKEVPSKVIGQSDIAAIFV